jgi:hypothetical protein
MRILFKFELKCGKMETKIIIRILRKQLDQVLLHEQEENGTTINNNLSADQEDRQFVTLGRVSQFEQKHLWIEERLAGHKTLEAILIFPCEVQINEA